MKLTGKQWHAIALAFGLAAVVLAYSNSFGNGFHFDDFHTVVDNPYIQSLWNIPRFFTDADTFSVLPANRTYRPLVSTSLALDYALGRGYRPFAFHLSTFAVFLLQLGAMLSLFRSILARAWGPRQGFWLPLFAVSWYGLHPAMAETVNYIIQRGDVFSTAGVVLALALYARFQGARRYGLYLLPFAAAMLSKPPAIVFPVLLLAYVAYFEPGPEAGPEKRWLRGLLAALPSAAVGALLLWVQSVMTPHSFNPAALSGVSYRLTQPFVLARYFACFFLPLHLNVDTDLRPFPGLNAQAAAGIMFLLALLATIVWTARRPTLRPISFGLLWFVVASLPTSVYPLAEVENDHRMYMPFIGLALAMSTALYLVGARWVAAVEPRRQRLAWGACALALLTPYAWGTHVRNRVWRTEESLWRDDVAKSPHNGRGLMIYGLTQMQAGHYPVALEYFQRALRETPNYPTLQINLGVVYAAMGNGPAAQAHFLRALTLAPADDQAHFFYGRWLLSLGQLEAAAGQLARAVELNPERLPARDLLLQCLLESGQLDAAQVLARRTLALAPGDLAARALLAQPAAAARDASLDLSLLRYQQHDFTGAATAAQGALRFDPKSELAWNNLGAALAGAGDYARAADAERHALTLRPDFLLARNNLAVDLGMLAPAAKSRAPSPEDLLNQSLLLYQNGHYAESLAAARAALKVRPDYAEAWNNIAANDAALGRWDDAIAAAQHALRLKPDFPLARNNLRWAQTHRHAGAQ